MPRKVRLVGAVSLVVVLVAVATVVGVRAWRAAHRTDIQRAIALAPADAERFTFTDWAGVRRELGAELGPDAPAGRVSDFLDRAYERDLSSSSAMIESTPVLEDKFGFSPASVDWELLSQSENGTSLTLKLADDADFDALADTLNGLGYERPADDHGVWQGGADLVARISDGQGLSPEFQFFALDAADHVLVSSDTASYAKIAIRAADGDGTPITGLEDVVAAVGDAQSAAVYTGDNVCRALAMSQADETDQAQADQAIADAGKVNPLTSFAMAAVPGGAVRVAMGFEDGDQARTNADTRATLASGPAIGQGGDFADRFAVSKASASGDVVVLDLKPTPDAFVLSDLSTGPVLFATC